MEKKQLQYKQECNEFEQKFKTITVDRNPVKNECLLIENISVDDEIDKLNENKRHFDCKGSEILNSEEKTDDDCIDERALIMVPPKPLPRTSISDQGSFEECNFSSSTAIPKPRPRSSANHGYKVYSFPLKIVVVNQFDFVFILMEHGEFHLDFRHLNIIITFHLLVQTALLLLIFFANKTKICNIFFIFYLFCCLN